MTLQPPDRDVKRPYHSPRRETQATETREAILDAAIGLFSTQGFRETSVRQVADSASVSEQTVYNVFEDKTGLLVAVGTHLMSSADGGEMAVFLEALAAEPDPMKRIQVAARYDREQWEEGALEIDAMLFGGDVKDHRLVDLADQVLEYKLEANRAVCEILFPDSIRRSGIDVEEIAVLATTMDSASSIKTLMSLGWTMDQYQDWITRLLALFLDPSALPSESSESKP